MKDVVVMDACLLLNVKLDQGYGAQQYFSCIERDVLMVDKTGVPGENPSICRKSLTYFIT
jgi:hypothetical protein